MEIRHRDMVYQAMIGQGLIDTLGQTIPERFGSTRCAIVTDSNIAGLHADRVERSLTTAGFQPVRITIPDGEQAKTLAQVGTICDKMLAAGLDRHSMVIGLGGGVIGDISGFAAAIFQRGIPHLQIPTTLLAMVDSSIGGKTGVNTIAGKNLIGAIHPPVMVIDDIDVLNSLPGREFKQGFAEIIKHGIIADAEMFEQLRAGDISHWRPNDHNAERLGALVSRNVRIKSEIVGKDESDRTGDRAILNFGHTIGHAIEQAGNYAQFLHGEAISLGIAAAARVSVKRAGLTSEAKHSIIDTLQRFDLPTHLPAEVSRDQIMHALRFDKKFEHGQIRFVVTPKIGSAYLSNEVTWADIAETVAAM